MRRIIWMGLSVALIGMSGQTARADFVVNGGFETGDFTGWTTANAPTGSDFGVSTGYAHTGIFGAFFAGTTVGSYDTIAQSLATTSGSVYVISFFLENLGPPNNGFEAFWGSTQLVSMVNSSSFAYTRFMFTLPAASNSTLLLFGGYQQPTAFGLDDISVVLAPVPEPASMTLLVVGLLGFGFANRRRFPNRSKSTLQP